MSENRQEPDGVVAEKAPALTVGRTVTAETAVSLKLATSSWMHYAAARFCLAHAAVATGDENAEQFLFDGADLFRGHAVSWSPSAEEISEADPDGDSPIIRDGLAAQVTATRAHMDAIERGTAAMEAATATRAAGATGAANTQMGADAAQAIVRRIDGLATYLGDVQSRTHDVGNQAWDAACKADSAAELLLSDPEFAQADDISGAVAAAKDAAAAASAANDGARFVADQIKHVKRGAEWIARAVDAIAQGTPPEDAFMLPAPAEEAALSAALAVTALATRDEHDLPPDAHEIAAAAWERAQKMNE